MLRTNVLDFLHAALDGSAYAAIYLAWYAGNPLIVWSRVGLKENRVGWRFACRHLRAVPGETAGP